MVLTVIQMIRGSYALGELPTLPPSLAFYRSERSSLICSTFTTTKLYISSQPMTEISPPSLPAPVAPLFTTSEQEIFDCVLAVVYADLSLSRRPGQEDTATASEIPGGRLTRWTEARKVSKINKTTKEAAHAAVEESRLALSKEKRARGKGSRLAKEATELGQVMATWKTNGFTDSVSGYWTVYMTSSTLLLDGTMCRLSLSISKHLVPFLICWDRKW